MIELVRTLWMGKAQYAIEFDRSENNRGGRPDDKRVPITQAQAALGIDACAALYETNRLVSP